MKKKDDMPRECAKQLKPFGKTIKDATDFYIRHLKRKKSTGRPKGTGIFSGITSRMEWSDIQKRMAGDKFKTKVVHLLEMASGARTQDSDAQRIVRKILNSIN